jgi:hypothetical protein
VEENQTSQGASQGQPEAPVPARDRRVRGGVIAAAAAVVAAAVVAVVMATSAGGSGTGSAGGSPVALPPPLTTTTTTAATPSRKLSPRGLIEKQFGENAGLGPNTGWEVTFSIDKAQLDPKCGPYSQPVDPGHHRLALWLRVATSPTYDPKQNVMFVSNFFSVVGPDGVTQSDLGTIGAYSCLLKDQFTQNPLSAASQYQGWVVLEVPATSGIIEFRPPYMDPGAGWEWKYPQA